MVRIVLQNKARNTMHTPQRECSLPTWSRLEETQMLGMWAAWNHQTNGNKSPNYLCRSLGTVQGCTLNPAPSVQWESVPQRRYTDVSPTQPAISCSSKRLGRRSL